MELQLSKLCISELRIAIGAVGIDLFQQGGRKTKNANRPGRKTYQVPVVKELVFARPRFSPLDVFRLFPLFVLRGNRVIETKYGCVNIGGDMVFGPIVGYDSYYICPPRNSCTTRRGHDLSIYRSSTVVSHLPLWEDLHSNICEGICIGTDPTQETCATVDRADYTVPTPGQHELDHTDHTKIRKNISALKRSR